MRTQTNWIALGLGLFVVLLAAWLLIPLFAGPVAESAVPTDLFSRLQSNYGPDALSQAIVRLRAQILLDIDGAPGPEELGVPVPTATWSNFGGAPPFTATPTPTLTSSPTPTSTPTETPTPTPTVTPTPTRTSTPKPSDTPKPTKTPAPTLTPSITPSPTPADTVPPVVNPGSASPGPGYLGNGVCAPRIDLGSIRVTDSPPSYGMSWVKLYYQIQDHTGLIFSDELPLVSGGATGDGGWEGNYAGSIVFEIDTDWDSEDPFSASLAVRARDKGGHEQSVSIGSYSIDESCDGG